MRAIAVTSVVAYHCFPLAVRGGFIGVDVFFVISGYLIGSLIYKEIRGRSFSITRFYERRAKRILPALFGVLLFSYFVAYLLLTPLGLKMFSTSAVATTVSASNIYFNARLKDYFAQNSDLNPLLMTWSLGVEEQFYIFFPLLMFLMRSWSWSKQFWGIAIPAFLSFGLSVWSTSHFQSFAFYMLPMRAWELAAGVLLAVFEANRHSARNPLRPPAAEILSFCGLALIVIGVLAFGPSTPFPGFAALLPVGGTVLVIAARDSFVNRALSLKPIVFVGLVSYSWYLWHWPLLSYARNVADAPLSIPIALGIGLASFGFAVLSYYFIEQPFRRSRQTGSRILLGYGIAAVLVMVPALVFHAANGVPQRNQAIARLEAEANKLKNDPCFILGLGSIPRQDPFCIPQGPRPAIALVGDSHAAQLGDALRTISAAHGYSFMEFTKGACPPLGAGITRSVFQHPELADDCAAFNRNWLATVIANRKIKVVIVAAWWAAPFRNARDGEAYLKSGDSESKLTPSGSAANLAYGLQQLVSQLTNTGKTVYLVQDNPEIEFDPLRTMETKASGPRRALAVFVAQSTIEHFVERVHEPPRSEDQEARALIETAARQSPKIHLIDLREQLCTADLCQISQGDGSLYNDTGHLSPLGAQIALSGFNPY